MWLLHYDCVQTLLIIELNAIIAVTVWMLVEDEPDIYEIILLMYDLIGVSGVAFTNGEDAIGWVDNYENLNPTSEPLQLALLDIRLPGDISGVDVGARLRGSPALNDLVLVLMTAYHLTPDEEEAVLAASGADMLVYKPLPRLNIFADALNEAVERRFGTD